MLSLTLHPDRRMGGQFLEIEIGIRLHDLTGIIAP